MTIQIVICVGASIFVKVVNTKDIMGFFYYLFLWVFSNDKSLYVLSQGMWELFQLSVPSF